MRIRPFAAHLVQAPDFTMSRVAVLLYKIARIEVRPPRAVLVDIAIESELWTALFIHLR
jgi:hypothetical protein